MPAAKRPLAVAPGRVQQQFWVRGSAAALLVAGFALAGCATPVTVEPPPAVPPECAQIIDALPDRVAGQDRRRTDPESTATAAWGDPPISVRCGVPVPDAYAPTAQLVTVNGVDWLPEGLSSGFRFTTVGLPANVEVTVPDAYEPEADVVAQLSVPISRASLPAPPPA